MLNNDTKKSIGIKDAISNFMGDNLWIILAVSIAHFLVLFLFWKETQKKKYGVIRLTVEPSPLHIWASMLLARPTLPQTIALFTHFHPNDKNCFLKFVSGNFLFFQQMAALKWLQKMLFIQSKKFFSFLRYSNFCISAFPLFFPCWPLL